jgi:hypothetical protein
MLRLRPGTTYNSSLERMVGKGKVYQLHGAKQIVGSPSRGFPYNQSPVTTVGLLSVER